MIGILGDGKQGKRYQEILYTLKHDFWVSTKPRFDCDNIIIATPVETHFSLCRRALDLGLNVLCEKPLVTDFTDAEYLLDLAKHRGVNAFVNHTHLYSKNWIDIKKRDLSSVKLGVFIAGGETGFDPKWDWGAHGAALHADLGLSCRYHQIIVPEKLKPRFVLFGDDTIVYEQGEDLPMVNVVTQFLNSKNDQSGFEIAVKVAELLM